MEKRLLCVNDYQRTKSDFDLSLPSWQDSTSPGTLDGSVELQQKVWICHRCASVLTKHFPFKVGRLFYLTAGHVAVKHSEQHTPVSRFLILSSSLEIVHQFDV